MQTFLSFLFTLLRGRALLVCMCCVSAGLIQAQAPCPPLTVQSVMVNQSIIGYCHPGLYEVNINSVVQYNTYYAYLYEVGNTTPYASVEVLGTFFDLEVFGPRPAGNYTLTVVPVSVNMGALPQYAISSMMFTLAAARSSEQPQILSCAGVIDNNVVTSDAPPTAPCVGVSAENLGAFNQKILGGTNSRTPNLRTAFIRQTLPTQDCLTDLAYLHYLYYKMNNNYLLRFRYRNNLSQRPIKAFDFLIDRTKLGMSAPATQQPTQQPSANDMYYRTTDYILFVDRLQGFLNDYLIKKLLPTDNTTTRYLSIEVQGL